jgi:hypothetical protein
VMNWLFRGLLPAQLKRLNAGLRSGASNQSAAVPAKAADEMDKESATEQ